MGPGGPLMRYLKQTAQEAAQKASVVPGMRHFAGSGPKGSTCGQCKHVLTSKHDAERECGEVSLKARKPFPATTPCCRYFKETWHG